MQRPLLVGEYEFTLDAKNRIAIPARLRPAFADGIYITRWHEDSLAGFAPEEFEKYLNDQAGVTAVGSSRGRSLVRFIAASATAEQLDRQGRVTIPARLLDYAAVTREVTIIGVKDHIEIWDRSAWASYLKSVEEGADAIADELAAS